jgi:hypothetical protein
VNGFIDHLHTTQNYKQLQRHNYLHNSQTTTAPVKHFPACSVFTRRSLATAFNSGGSSASRAQILSPQPPMQNSSGLTTLPGTPIVFKITPRHGPRTNILFQQYSIVACVFVAAGTCLLSRNP